ncbi:MAG: chemotaxis protein CheD [Candidatus Margulisiibacteriota bacterium]
MRKKHIIALASSLSFSSRCGNYNIIHVEIGDYKVSSRRNDILKTVLGSCVGVVLYDNILHVGGILHIYLPDSNKCSHNDYLKPTAFADTGVPILIQTMTDMGCKIYNLRAALYGGGHMMGFNVYNTGEDNINAAKKALAGFYIKPRKEVYGGDQGMVILLRINDGKVRHSFHSAPVK